MRGDQRNLKVQGICVRLNSPTTRRSTPTLRIQSGMAIHTSPRGRPEEKLRSTTEAVRQDFMASTRLRYPESLFAGWPMPHKLGGDKPLCKSRFRKRSPGKPFLQIRHG